jgi:hypothetical protein
LIWARFLQVKAGIMETISTGKYRGSTTAELSSLSAMDKVKAALDQRLIFPHRGEIVLSAERLVLTGWHGDVDVVVHPSQIASVSNEFTDLYGRFLGGGVKKWGAPIVLDLAPDPALYLLVNHQWFSERTDNVEWTERLNGWLDAARSDR